MSYYGSDDSTIIIGGKNSENKELHFSVSWMIVPSKKKLPIKDAYGETKYFDYKTVLISNELTPDKRDEVFDFLKEKNQRIEKMIVVNKMLVNDAGNIFEIGTEEDKEE